MLVKRVLRAVFAVTIPIGFIAFLAYYVGFEKLLAPWVSLSTTAPLLAIIMFVSYLARAMRIYAYCRDEVRGRFRACLKLTLYHNALNNFLPMRSGEISFPVLMARYFGMSPRITVPLLVWFRLLDLHALLCIGLAAVTWHSIGPVPAFCAAALCIPVPFLIPKGRVWLLRKLSSHRGHSLTRIMRDLIEVSPKDLNAVWNSLLWTWVNWSVKLAALAWVLAEVSGAAPSTAIYSAILGDLTSVLPIHSVGGFGTYEAGIAAGLVPSGIPFAEALPAAVTAHLLVLGVSSLGGLFAVLIPPGGEKIL